MRKKQRQEEIRAMRKGREEMKGQFQRRKWEVWRQLGKHREVSETGRDDKGPAEHLDITKQLTSNKVKTIPSSKIGCRVNI